MSVLDLLIHLVAPLAHAEANPRRLAAFREEPLFWRLQPG